MSQSIEMADGHTIRPHNHEEGEISSEQPEDTAHLGVEADDKNHGPLYMMITLIGTRMGGGMVSLPYAGLKVGYVFSLLFQVFYIPVGVLSVHLLLRAKDISGRASLGSLGAFCYGNISIYFINTLIALSQLGFPIIFFIVFGDIVGGFIRHIDGKDSFWTSRIFTQGLLGIGMLYFIIKKEIHGLRFAATWDLIFTVIFMILFFVHYLVSDSKAEDNVDLLYTNLNLEFFSLIPTMLSTYTFQTSFFSAFVALKNKTNVNGHIADTGARIGNFFVFVTMPLLSYGLYGNSVQSNLLGNIAEEKNVLAIILQIWFLIIAVLDIQMVFFVGKEAWLMLFDEITRKTYSKQNNHAKAAKAAKDAKDAKEAEENEAVDENNSISGNEGEEVPSEPAQDNNVNNPSPNKEPESANKVINNEERKSADYGDEVATPGIVQENDDSGDSESTMESVHLHNPKEYLTMHPAYYYAVTISVWLIVAILSIAVGKVDVFFGLIGSTTGFFVVFAGPGSFYLISVHKMGLGLPDMYCKVLYVFAWIYLIIGILGMVGFTVVVLANAIV